MIHYSDHSTPADDFEKLFISVVVDDSMTEKPPVSQVAHIFGSKGMHTLTTYGSKTTLLTKDYSKPSIVVTDDVDMVRAIEDNNRTFKENTLAFLWMGESKQPEPTRSPVVVFDTFVRKDIIKNWQEFAQLATQPPEEQKPLSPRKQFIHQAGLVGKKLLDIATFPFRNGKYTAI